MSKPERQFFMPEIVYERPPTQLDKIKRTADFIGNVALILGNKVVDPRGKKLYMGRADVYKHLLGYELRDRSLVFAKEWRNKLDFDQNPNGFGLSFATDTYTFEGTLRTQDTYYAAEGTSCADTYHTVVDSEIRQKTSGHTTRLRVAISESVTYAEKIGQETRSLVDRVYAGVTPRTSSGDVDNTGWGFYSLNESNNLDELGLGVLSRIDGAARDGILSIVPLEDASTNPTWYY